MNRMYGLLLLGVSLLAGSLVIHLRNPFQPSAPLVADNPFQIVNFPVTSSQLDRAAIKYILHNQSSYPVTIDDIISGCGCTSAKATLSHIPPGERTILSVEATGPSSGFRDVPIHVYYSLPNRSSRSLDLIVRLIGNRNPPYIETVQGDLVFDSMSNPHSSKLLTIVSIEFQGHAKHPILTSNLDCVRIQLANRKETPLNGTKSVIAIYTFAISLNSPPPSGVAGNIKVSDPWTHQAVQSLQIYLPPAIPFKITPNPIVLVKGTTGKFMARVTSGHNTSLQLTPNHNGLHVTQLDHNTTTGIRYYQIHIDDSLSKSTEHSTLAIHVESYEVDGTPSGTASIPVRIE